MTPPAPSPRDPVGISAALALAFLALVCWHLGIPSHIYFDEVHYVAAARKLLALQLANPEHPLLAKEAIAAAIALFGDHPWAWRLPSALAGAMGLFAFGRALWWASGRRWAALFGMGLLATNFAWFVQSRIAMLDMVMACFAMVALWLLAAAMALPPGTPIWQRRWRLAATGLCLGLAMGAKWSVLPLVALIGTGFVALRWVFAGPRLLEDETAPPAPGIPLMEAVFWLGTVPLVTYWATYAPAFFYRESAVNPWDIAGWHRYMVGLQSSVHSFHPYQSHWYQWLGNWRPIWYLYEVTDGAQRGILLVGNPLTMLAGLPAMVWCLWAGIWRGRRDALAVAGCFAATLGLWLLPGKPVQFYYHYLLPGTFLMAALALALDALWTSQKPVWRLGRWLAPAVLAAAAALFIWFHPIISGAPLAHGRDSFEDWMWLESWR